MARHDGPLRLKQKIRITYDQKQGWLIVLLQLFIIYTLYFKK